MNERPAEFVIDRDYTFFTPLDIMATFLGVIVILILINAKVNRNKDKEYYKYYPYAFLFKMFFVLANCTFYIVVYGAGGDSIGFWDGSVKLNNLFWKDPFLYFEEIFKTTEYLGHLKNFDATTGYPDARIYGEHSSFFISKIASFFTFFTFKGYILMSIVFSFIATNVSWRLFELLREFKTHSDWHLAFAILFIPSLSFWCGGISKDTVVWVTVCIFLVNLYSIMSPERKGSLKNWIVIFICFYVLLQVRSFMLMTVLAPLLFAYSANYAKRKGSKSFQSRALKFFIAIVGVVGILVFFQTSIADEFLQEAAVINQDMSTNKTYGPNRYDLGVTDYSPAGMISAMPASIIAGFFRPFIWESLSVSLILNGIESMVLIYFTLRFFFSGKLGKRIRRVRSHEFLVFAFFFALILAYFAGFTSILFGVLVRFKAPVLPFLILVLTAHYLEEKREKEAKEESETASDLTNEELGLDLNDSSLRHS